MQGKKKSRAALKPVEKANDWDPPAHDTIITKHTQTQALDDEAQRELERDVESAKSADPIFVTIRGNAQGKKHTIQGGQTVLGRSRQAEIRILDPSVSGKHAIIVRDEQNNVYLDDLGSNNGTYVNNERVRARVKLNKEDMITIGTTILKYVPAGELEILYHGNLIKAAYMDRLTGIYNHNYIVEALEAEFKRAKALGQKFSIILIDIDHFKEINDTLGHSAGDFILREFCQMVTSGVLRPNETMGRYGGDEFIVLLWNNTAAEAGTVAERIQTLMDASRIEFEGKDVRLTVSCGVAAVSPNQHTVKDFFNDADKALYASKAKGRNCVTVFHP